MATEMKTDGIVIGREVPLWGVITGLVVLALAAGKVVNDVSTIKESMVEIKQLQATVAKHAATVESQATAIGWHESRLENLDGRVRVLEKKVP